MDAGRIDGHDPELPSSAVSEEVVQDHDGMDLTVKYNSKRETLPILSVFAYYA